MLLISTYDVCFCGEIRKITIWIALILGAMELRHYGSLPSVLFYYSSCGEDQAHNEFKKHIGAACVMYNPEQSLLLVLVS